jgi:hypothetical protein
MINIKNIRELGIKTGFLGEARKGVDNLLVVFKKFLKVLNIPFYDECCSDPAVPLPVGYTDSDGVVRYNPETKEYESVFAGGSGTDYIHVLAKGTPEENAEEFIAAYAKADDADKNSENRFTLILSPGHYKFQETFEHNVDNINIVSLTGEQDVIFDLELDEEDPVQLSEDPPIVPFKHIFDLTIDINDGDTVYTGTLQEIPYFLTGTGQASPQVQFDANGLGFKGNPSNTTVPVYTNFLLNAADIIKVSYHFIQNNFTGDNYQERHIYIYDSSIGLASYGQGNVYQMFGSVDNNGTLTIYNNDNGNGIGISLTDGDEYILELIYDPIESTQTVNVKDLSDTIIGTTSITFVALTGSFFGIALGMANQGPSYYPDIISTSSVMNISADYSTVSGIKTKEYTSENYVTWSNVLNNITENSYYPLPLNVIIDEHDNLEVKNCTAGPFSFGSDPIGDNFDDGDDFRATFTDCTSLAYSFGYGAYQIESGSVFTNCKTGNYSFHIYDDLDGTYTNCTAGSYSFYSDDDRIEGTFTNCIAEDYSFYSDDDNFNGATFTNCTGGYRSFYADDDFTEGVTFINCVAGNSSFEADEYIDSSVSFINCTAGDNSFIADDGNNNGTFTNCTAGDDSFYAYNSIGTSATFTNCSAGDNSFRASSNDIRGTFRNCTAGISSFNASAYNGGTYINCTGQQDSFSSNNEDYGSNLFYCLLYGSIFGGGNMEYCVDNL